MAEKIVSPGVFTEEKDLSFLPQGISEIGAAFVGPTLKGPAMVPTTVSSYNEFVQTFGNTNPNLYLPYTAKEYLNSSGQLTIVRTLHDDGYKVVAPVALVASGSFGKKHIALIHPSQVINETSTNFAIATATTMFEKTALSSNTSGSAVVKISGSYTIDAAFTVSAGSIGSSFSASLSSTSANYVSKVFSKIPNTSTQPGFLYTLFDTAASASLAADPACFLVLETGSYTSDSTFSNASTPYIISQTVNNTNYNLFRFHTISDGTSANYEIKVAISNIKAAGTVPGSVYGSFTVAVRSVDQTYLKAVGSPYDAIDTDVRPNILEVFDNVNLDPNSARYIARVIGDRYRTFTNGKVILNGDYANKSKYVYVEMDSDVAKAAISDELVPFGHAALISPLPSSYTAPVSASLIVAQSIAGIYNKRVHFGFNYDLGSTDNINYLKPLPAAADQTVGGNAKFFNRCNSIFRIN